jgi:hypothetical protein
MTGRQRFRTVLYFTLRPSPQQLALIILQVLSRELQSGKQSFRLLQLFLVILVAYIYCSEIQSLRNPKQPNYHEIPLLSPRLRFRFQGM